MGNIPLLYETGYPKFINNPWPNNWNSPELTEQINQMQTEINNVMYWNSFKATNEPATASKQYFDILKLKFPKINWTKIIQYGWK